MVTVSNVPQLIGSRVDNLIFVSIIYENISILSSRLN